MMKQLIAALVVVAALLVTYVFMTEPPPTRDAGPSWTAPNLESFDRIEINQVDSRLVLEASDGGWRIVEPVEFSASTRATDRLVALFADPERRLLVDNERDASPANLTRFGFDDTSSVIHVVLFDGGEQAAAFAVANTEDSSSGAVRTWVLPRDAESVYRVNRELRSALEQPLEDWRDADILVLTPEQQDALDSVTVAYGDTTLTFEKQGEGDEATWAMSAPADVEGDGELIERFIPRVDTLRAAGFADDLDTATAGLDTPEHVVTLVTGDDTFTLRFGASFTGEPADDGGDGESLRYVQRGDGPIFEVRETTASNFMKRLGDFLPRDMLTLSRDDITGLTLSNEGGNITLFRNEIEEGEEIATWRMRRPRRVAAVDADAIRQLLDAAAEVEAKRVAEGEVSAEAAGLTSPRRTVTVTLADETTHTIHLGGAVDPDDNPEDETRWDRYARVDDGPIFEIASRSARHLLKSLDDLDPPEEAEDE